jgi:hypothetical protein
VRKIHIYAIECSEDFVERQAVDRLVEERRHHLMLGLADLACTTPDIDNSGAFCVFVADQPRQQLVDVRQIAVERRRRGIRAQLHRSRSSRTARSRTDRTDRRQHPGSDDGSDHERPTRRHQAASLSRLRRIV